MISQCNQLRIFSIVFITFLFSLAACGPTDSEIALTVEQLAEIEVRSTISSIPTNTPLPTLTKLPTLTTQPTNSPQPTFTPLATLTALPTLMLLPTLTLPPTATSSPTATSTSTAIPVTAAPPIPPADAFSLEDVNVTSYWMHLVGNGIVIVCEKWLNNRCTRYSEAADCQTSVANYASFEATIKQTPSSSEPQIVNYHQEYLRIVRGYRFTFLTYINSCREELGLAPLPPIEGTSSGFDHIFNIYEALNALRSMMEQAN